MGGFLSPPYSHPSSTGTTSTSGATPEVSSPWGNSSTPGLSMPLGNLTPPPTPWQPPLGFSALPEASRPPSLPPTPECSLARVSLRPATLSLSPGLAPWQPPAPASSLATAGCCTLRIFSCADSCRYSFCLRPRLSDLPCLPHGLSLLLCCQSLPLLATTLGAFV